ncbi:zinc-binding dehydrogenase [Acidocella sp.]|uniref:zinc-binding dehydrogenase n=1 Tax=Acidocella sp. TaxID=50710 RepID=UPI003CFCEFBE
MAGFTGLTLHSTITEEGQLLLSAEEVTAPPPGPGEIIVRVEAAPLNPSDIGLLLGPADLSTLRSIPGDKLPGAAALVPPSKLTSLASRLNRALPIGNEGAGSVMQAGEGAEHLLGRKVAFLANGGAYAQYRTVKATECLVLPGTVSIKEAAGAFVNPLTALGMVETMRRENHHAIVHTAAASNLGQMLNRLCLADDVPLVNIVRNPTQADLLRGQGARHVVDSSSADFQASLVTALEETGATLAFDAIGGGTMASVILASMEQVLSRRLRQYSRYGSPVPKQVYIYGSLDTGPKIFEGQFGMAWNVGGWLMSWFYERIGVSEAARLRSRAIDHLTNIFASHYSKEITLAEALSPPVIQAYARRATGEKYLLLPNEQLAC